ncbi:MAG: dolichyl-phosphate beta-glucosyltransferase [bacterium]
MDFSIVIPAYNEAKRLGKSLDIIMDFMKKWCPSFEVIVVDDGSKDSTSSIVEEKMLNHKELKLVKLPQNRGKGYAVKTGIMKAKGRYILFSDADLSTPIEELPNLFFWVEKGYDIAIASRACPGAKLEVHQPMHREFMGRVFNLLVRLILLPGVYDTQCGFKLFRREVAREIFQRQRFEGFSFDFEILYIAKKLGYKIKEVPVRWRHSPGSKVKVLRNGISSLVDVFKTRLRRIR